MPDRKALQGMFFVHLILGGAASSILWFAAPFLVSKFSTQLTDSGVFLLRLSSLSFVFYNIRLIPAALLERNLSFRKLVIGEVFEVILTQFFTVVLALWGLSVSSFVWGLVLARAATGVLFFLIRPWPVGIDWQFLKLRPYFSFGIAYQVHQLIGILGGTAAVVIVGFGIGSEALGFVVWAGGITAVALTVSETVSRVIFAIVSRVQKDKVRVGRFVEKSIHFTNILALPLNLLLVVLAEPLTRIIYTEKWLPGLSLIYVFSLQSTLNIFSSIMQNALLALGESKIVRNLSFLRTVSLWVCSYFFVSMWGVIGFAWASIAASATTIVLWWVLRQRVRFRILPYTLPYFFLSGLSSLCVYGLSYLIPINDVFTLVFAGFFGLVIYTFLILTFSFSDIKENISLVRSAILK